MNSDNETAVIGHVNPSGSYPSFVIPVVRRGDSTCCVFLSESGDIEFHLVSEFTRKAPISLPNTRPGDVGDYQLSVIRVSNVGKLPIEGSNLIVIALIGEERQLRFRIFNEIGEIVVDISEDDLPNAEELIIGLRAKVLDSRTVRTRRSDFETSIIKTVLAITRFHLPFSQHWKVFAFSPSNSVCFQQTVSEQFWEYAVNREDILSKNPFAGLDIACETKSRSSMLLALSACIRELKESKSGAQFYQQWYAVQLVEIGRVYSESVQFPESADELIFETLLVPEVDLVGAEFSTIGIDERLAHDGVEVRGAKVERRENKKLFETFLELTSIALHKADREIVWRVFFDHIFQRKSLEDIADRFQLPGVEAVKEGVELGMSTFRQIVEREVEKNPLLRGLSQPEALQAALRSGRLFALPQGLDIVFCIDVTGSMEPFIEGVRRIVSTFHEKLVAGLNRRGISVGGVNARIVAFRDYFWDEEPMIETPFWQLPKFEPGFRKAVNDLGAGGGNDEPESGLEALCCAIDSQWISGGDNSAHIVMLFTDASAHSFEKASADTPDNYPASMPQSLKELKAKWDSFCLHSSAAVQRLVLFAPDDYPWPIIHQEFSNTLFLVSRAGAGLREVPEDLIVESIAQGLN